MTLMCYQIPHLIKDYRPVEVFPDPYRVNVPRQKNRYSCRSWALNSSGVRVKSWNGSNTVFVVTTGVEGAAACTGIWTSICSHNPGDPALQVGGRSLVLWQLQVWLAAVRSWHLWERKKNTIIHEGRWAHCSVCLQRVFQYRPLVIGL